MKKIFIGLVAAIMLIPALGSAAIQQGPMITVRFDDGLTTQYTNAAPILKKYNFPATAYIFTDPPQEGNWIGYMNWTQIKELQNTYGWEIGSHTKSHPDLTTLDSSQLIAELSESKTLLNNQGFTAKSFSSPFGEYNNNVLSYVARYYESHNSAWPLSYNAYPFNDYDVSVQEVRGKTSLAQVKKWIDGAVSDEKWLVLLFHGIVTTTPGEYECSKTNFEAVVDYIKTKNVPVITISDALKMLGTNLFLNPSFDSLTTGWADNWLRTDTVNSTVDTNNNGSLPSFKNTLKLAGGANKNNTYTKDFISVVPGKTYALKTYFNCQNFSSGGVDVFIDEYDASGKWINWKWQTGIWSAYVGTRSVAYTPSQNAAKAMIWIQVPASSNLTCYIDNVFLADAAQ